MEQAPITVVFSLSDPGVTSDNKNKNNIDTYISISGHWAIFKGFLIFCHINRGRLTNPAVSKKEIFQGIS